MMSASRPHEETISTRLEIERLAPLLARPDLELNFVTVTQVLEIDLGREPRAMEKDFLAPIIRDDEPEALVLHDFLDRAVHLILFAGAPALLYYQA
jgi:hypothetical protein